MKKSTEAELIAAGVLVAAAALPFVLTWPGKLKDEDRKKFVRRNYAHRGLHTEDKFVPENSLKAFQLAAEGGYGVELDIQLSKDGQVVVFHDDTLDRVCKVEGRVDEFDYSELHAMHLEGSQETIPLFTDVLNTIHGRGPIIVELKTGKRNKELCKKALAILKDYSGDFCIESFDPMIVYWFKKNAPEIVRGQLAQPADRYKSYPAVVRLVLGNCLMTPLNRPHFIAYKEGRRPLTVRLSRALGAMLFAWTPHDRMEEKHNDGMIFEFYRPERTY